MNLDDPALLQSSKHNQNKLGRGNVRVYQPGKITVRFASFEPSPYTKQCQKEKALCSFRRRSVMKKYEYTNTDATPKSFDPQRIERITKLCKLEADIEKRVVETFEEADSMKVRAIVDSFFLVCHQAFGKEEFYEILTRFVDAAKQ